MDEKRESWACRRDPRDRAYDGGIPKLRGPRQTRAKPIRTEGRGSAFGKSLRPECAFSTWRRLKISAVESPDTSCAASTRHASRRCSLRCDQVSRCARPLRGAKGGGGAPVENARDGHDKRQSKVPRSSSRNPRGRAGRRRRIVSAARPASAELKIVELGADNLGAASGQRAAGIRDTDPNDYQVGKRADRGTELYIAIASRGRSSPAG